MFGVSHSLGVYRPLSGGGGGAPVTPPALPAITSWQGMFDDNAANLSGQTFALDDHVQIEGDSLSQGDFGGTVSVGQEWAAQIGDYITSTINKTAVSGNTSSVIEARILASGASVLDNYTLFNAGTNDTGLASSVTLANIANIADTLSVAKFGVWVPLLATERTFSDLGARDAEISNGIYNTYWPYVLDMQQIHAAAEGDSTLAATQAEAATGNIIDVLSDDGLHQNAAGHDAHTEPAARLLLALNDKAPYLPDHPPIKFDPAVAEGTTLYTVQTVGNVDGFDITGGNSDSVFAISDAGVITRGSGAWSDADGIRELFVTAWESENDVYHTARVPMVATGSQGDQVRWGRGTFRAEDILSDSETKITIAIKVDYSTPATTRKTVFSFEDANDCTVGSGLRQIVLKQGTSGGSTIAVRNFATFTGYNWLILSYDSTADAGAGRYYWTQQNSGGSGPAFNSGGSVDMSGTCMFGEPFGGTYDDLDIECLGIWPGAWDLTSATERDKFFNSTTFASAMADTGIIDGITPAIFMYGGPGDWLQEFSNNELRVANKGSFPGASFTQFPLADVSLAGFKSI